MDKQSATVLVIAHRLATVVDADRILVMADGAGVEYDHPFNLLVESPEDTCITRQDGFFAKMVTATGPQSAESLFNIAKEKYFMSENVQEQQH